jgi:D-tyrosyl-tRNA(Tyr) deacylase
MKAVIQRVSSASVKVDERRVGEIEKGLLVLLGVAKDDTDADAEVLAKKIANLRIFSDPDDKMNLSVKDIGGKMLIISNFTLCADTKKGTRPSFDPAMPPQEADRLYEYFCNRVKEVESVEVQKGIFGADMKVNLLNDGPVTLIMDSTVWRK